jgi:diguanylate cyclase (GGDEF)-like protein
MIHNATAALYRNNQIHDKAYEYFLKAYEAWVLISDVKDMFNMQHALVGESIALGNWQTASSHVKELFNLADKNPEFGDFIFFAYFNKARLAMSQNNFTSSIENFEKALKLQETTQESFFINQAKSLLAMSYFRSNNIDKAYQFAKLHLDSLVLKDETKEDVIASQAIIDFYNGNHSKAMNNIWLLKDKEKQSRLDFLKNSVKDQTIYFEQNLTEFQNQALEQQLSINSLKLKNEQVKNRITSLTIIIFILVIIMFIVVVIYLFNSRKYFIKHAQQDFLTGLDNRRFTFVKGNRIITEANKLQQPVSLIIFDIDNFKSINDKYGHDAGDKVLQQIATISKNQILKDEILGRIGGEEFLIVLPDMKLHQALEKAEQLREEIESADITINSHHLTVTISLGVSSNHGFKSHLDLIVKEADLALYKAKQNGRNQVQVYNFIS